LCIREEDVRGLSGRTVGHQAKTSRGWSIPIYIKRTTSAKLHPKKQARRVSCKSQKQAKRHLCLSTESWLPPLVLVSHRGFSSCMVVSMWTSCCSQPSCGQSGQRGGLPYWIVFNISMKAALFSCVVFVGRPKSARAPGNAWISKKAGPSAAFNASKAASISDAWATDATCL